MTKNNNNKSENKNEKYDIKQSNKSIKDHVKNAKIKLFTKKDQAK